MLQGKEERGSRKIAGGVLSCSGCLKGGGTDDLAELCCRVCCTLPDAWLRFERSPPDLEEISHLVVPLEQEVSPHQQGTPSAYFVIVGLLRQGAERNRLPPTQSSNREFLECSVFTCPMVNQAKRTRMLCSFSRESTCKKTKS